MRRWTVVKVFGVAGWKNSGKTTLVERLAAEFVARGLVVSTIKHAHHEFDIDKSGTDSFKHREAGAAEVLISSSKRWALMHENSDGEAALRNLLSKLSPADIIIVEGYKNSHLPKIETRRKDAPASKLSLSDKTVQCVACQQPSSAAFPPEIDINDTGAIAEFVLMNIPSVASAIDALTVIAPSSGSSMPPGVNWIPVDAALNALRIDVSNVTGTDKVPAGHAVNRVLAEAVYAQRSSPPVSNSAVDGFGFNYDSIEGNDTGLRLVDWMQSAGAPPDRSVPKGKAVRILTGASLPAGVDTVVLDEHSTVSDGIVNFRNPKQRGQNTRQAGEDQKSGDLAFDARHRLKPSDMASLIASGTDSVTVREKLRVSVISTGK